MKRILLSLSLIAFPLIFYAQTKTVTFSNTGSSSFYVPAGVPSVNMTAWGGGGGGGGTTVPAISLQRGGGGGGGGAYASGLYTMNTGIVNLSITVGTGGAGGIGNNAGQNGFSSFIAGYVTAVGGGGGAQNTANTELETAAGGLPGDAINCTGQNNISGTAGSAGTTALLGASSGSGGQGANGGGAGGASVGSLLGNDNGKVGLQAGGGGSGSKSSLLFGVDGTGGAGGAGKVVISYDCPTYSLTSTIASTVNLCAGTMATITLSGNLPVGLYSVSYQVGGVTQPPVSMHVSVSGSGLFIAPGFTTLGSKSVVINSLTSGTSATASENCTSPITLNNSATVNTISLGTAPLALAGTGATCNQITANWNAVAGTSYYVLDVSTDVNFGSFVGTYNALNVGNVLTYPVTGLSNATSYYYRVRAFSGSCISANSNTISYKPAVAPGNVVLSTATNIGCTTFTANWSAEVNAVSYLLDVSTVSNFASFVGSYNSLDIGKVTSYAISGLNAGQIYYYRLRSKNGCGTGAAANATVQNTTTLIVTMPQNDGLVQPTCLVQTGTLSLKGLPNRNDYTIVQTGTVPNTYSRGTGADFTKYTITGLAPGTYSFSVTFPGGCSSPALTNIIVNPLITNTYTTAGGWSNGATNGNQNIVFADNFSSTGDLFSCTCKVNAGKKVTINSLHTLKIDNQLIVDNAAGTELIFENNSSLLQVNSIANSGNITYKRTAKGIRQADFVYWSAPVSSQKLINVSPETEWDKYFYNNAPGWIQVDRNTNMLVGKGYIIRGPETFSNTAKADYTASFIGVPNNGNLSTEPLTSGKYHLIGNPYPSALSADALINGNTVLNGTLYFWTHNTPVVPVGNYDYTTDDYASYNLSGGVATAKSAKSDPGHSDNPANDLGVKPTGKIGAGQAFFVSTRLPGPVNFINTMRYGGTDNSQFFKENNTADIEKRRIWLNMTNTDGLFKQLLVGYIQGATNAYENKYDGVSFDANPYLDFYSMINASKFVIQGRALPFNDSDIVPLGYRTTVEGTFTIAIDQVDENMNNQAIYIEDKVTGAVHDLRISNYSFTTAVGTFTDRFVLRYTAKTLGTDEFQAENAVVVSNKNKTIQIVSSQENIKQVMIFDILGKQLFNNDKIEDTVLSISNLPAANQVLIVKVILNTNYTETKKIVF